MYLIKINKYYILCYILQENFIRTIGGRDGKEHISRVLAKLLTDEYAGKNIITKMGNSVLIKITKSNLMIIYN